jgi:SAM-dependent methyltransferase
MALAAPHDVYALPDHDDGARECFVRELMVHVQRDLMPGKRVLYDRVVKPRFVGRHQRPPKDRHEVRHAMEEEPYNQMWSALRRTTQEIMQDVVGESVERQLPELIDRCRTVNPGAGSLALDPGLEVPRYLSAVDIHCKPGGYHTEIAPDDVFAGATYERTNVVFNMGTGGPLNDDRARSMIAFIGQRFPDLEPKRILDVGCTIGFNTLPYVDAYPEAEVFGIDVAAPCLRFAHARATALGKTVHFSQQNAERTNFADGSFDLIVSVILMHETANRALRNIFRECHRILRPGGVMLHMDTPQYNLLTDPYDQTLGDWSTHYNAEPFWGTLHELDLTALMVEAGFERARCLETAAPSLFLERADSAEFRARARRPNRFLAGARR